uniref:YceI family protein n=1 Tax=Solibacter usitatus (strain Ellin6076) TaxID=234267 RepID=Q01Y84_SOLUE
MTMSISFMKLRALILTCSALQAQTPPLDPQLKYIVESKKSSVQFFVHSTLSDVDGVFSNWKAEFKVPTPRIEDATLILHVVSSSVSTGSGSKDRLIKGENFFWIQRYPSIDFVSTKITADPSDPLKFTMDGNFTMRGVTKPVTVRLTLDPQGNHHGTVDGDMSFDRREFGMTYKMPFNRISDSVRVSFKLDVQGTPAKGTGTATRTAK